MIAYTDGSYKQNVNLGSWGYIILDDRGCIQKEELIVVKDSPTTNKCELLGVINCILEVGPQVKIFLDCKYVVDNYNKNIKYWSKNNYQKSKNRKVKYWQLWQQLNSISTKDTKILWVKKNSNVYSKYISQLVKNY